MRPHEQFLPPHLPRAITVPATSLWFNLEVSAARYPDKPALIFFGQAMTYAQLKSGAERLAAYLQSLGVQKGERVLLDMQNCPQLVMAHYAILRADAVVVPINPMNRAEELQHYISDAEARVAITTGERAAEMAAASGALPEGQRLQHLIVTQYTDSFDPAAAGEEAPSPAWASWLLERQPLPALAGGQVHDWQTALACEGPLAPAAAGPQDLSVLPYTSGTTGKPKGCMHSHASIMHNAVACGLWTGAHAESVLLAVVPMFHVTGMIVVMHGGIYMGATLVLMPRWDRELAGRLISRWRVSVFTNIPTMIIDLLASPNVAKFDLSSLKVINGGGAAMPQAVAERLQQTYGLIYGEGYGLTETAAPSHHNPPGRAKLQCLGVPFIGVQARVVDPETLEEMPVGEQGEIVMSGPQIFHGYWKRPEATEQAFFEKDGMRFFRSGDLGHVDEEGYFFLTDRLKRMINASGFKVWPAEVESIMYKHPAIQEACIIATRDAYRGESVKAVVVLRPEHQGKVSEQDIIDWCREHMAAYKIPRTVQFIDALPKSGSGKVMWRQLQEAEQTD